MMPSPPQANGGYTLRVAASNSSAQNKQGADYLCTGTNDEVQIQAAINALPATGGKVILEAGTYTLGAGLVIASNAIILEGEGNGTLIQFSGANNAPCLSSGSSTIPHYYMQVKNLFLQDTDGNGTGIDCSYWSLALVSNVRIYGVKVGINGNGQGQGTCLYNYFENVTIQPSPVTGNVGMQLTNTANENTCMRIRIVANAQTTGLINAAHGNSFYDYDVEGAAVGIDVQTGGDDCSIFAPYLEDNKINFQIAANVEACSLFGGTCLRTNTTSSINNLGAKGLNIYNLRLNYEQFTHSEVQNGFPKNRDAIPNFV